MVGCLIVLVPKIWCLMYLHFSLSTFTHRMMNCSISESGLHSSSFCHMTWFSFDFAVKQLC